MAERKKLMVNGGRGRASLEAAGLLSHHLERVSYVWMSRWLAASGRSKAVLPQFSQLRARSGKDLMVTCPPKAQVLEARSPAWG